MTQEHQHNLEIQEAKTEVERSNVQFEQTLERIKNKLELGSHRVGETVDHVVEPLKNVQTLVEDSSKSAQRFIDEKWHMADRFFRERRQQLEQTVRRYENEQPLGLLMIYASGIALGFLAGHALLGRRKQALSPVVGESVESITEFREVS